MHQPPWSFGFDSQTRGTRENRRHPVLKYWVSHGSCVCCLLVLNLVSSTLENPVCNGQTVVVHRPRLVSRRRRIYSSSTILEEKFLFSNGDLTLALGNLGMPSSSFALTLPTRSTTPAVAGCRLVGCSVVSGLPLRSRAVTGVSLHVCVCLGPVLASHAPSPVAAADAVWRGLGLVPILGWSCG